MLNAPNYKIKCETKMDCVKQSWMKYTTNKHFSRYFLSSLLLVLFVLLFDCLRICVAAVRVIFRSESLLVAKVFFFTYLIFNILFVAYYLAFFPYIQTMFCLRLFFAVDSNLWKCVCVVCLLRKINYFR